MASNCSSGSQPSYVAVSSSELQQQLVSLDLDGLKKRFHGTVDSDVIELLWIETSGQGHEVYRMLVEMSSTGNFNGQQEDSNLWSQSRLTFNEGENFPSLPSSQAARPMGRLEKLKADIESGERILVIMRGLPGSGKSYLAKQLKGRGVILTTDDYFMDKFGNYNFQPENLHEAHLWNQNRARKKVREGSNPVIIDNTNLEAWEMRPYIDMGVSNGYRIELLEPETTWKYDPRILAQKNRHGVPRETIRRMLDKLSFPVDINAIVQDIRQKQARFQPESEVRVQNMQPVSKPAQVEPPAAPPPAEMRDCETQTSHADFRIDSGCKIIVAKPGGIEHSSSRIAANFQSSPYRKPSGKLTLDKGCNTEDVDDDEDVAAKQALSVLTSYFPTATASDLADVLEKCQGNLNWAFNLLLDSGYECAEHVISHPPEDIIEEDTKEMEQNERGEVGPDAELNEECEQVVESEEANKALEETTVRTGEETELLRRQIESCFTLNDTISDRARRICGKDYNQFRASQMQKARQGVRDTSMDIPVPLATSDNPTASESINTNPVCTEEDVYPESPEAMIPITLNQDFSQQLVSLFGAPESSDLSSEDLQFEIPWSLAEQLYSHWCASLACRKKPVAERSWENECPVQQEDDTALQTIMDMELAIQLAEDERNAERQEIRNSMATKLSMQMLRDSFPGIDPLALEALFEAHGFNYNHTVSALNASLETRGRPQGTVKPVELAESSTSAQSEPKTENHASGRDLREQALLYQKRRREFSQKASEYYRRGLTAVAAYYANESKNYADLYREANKMAGLQIIQEKNAQQDERTIDLHELHVNEALSYLESFIAENLRDGKTVISVITGQGNHSVNGRPRIKPAVEAFLERKKYRYYEVNAGMLRVFLRR